MVIWNKVLRYGEGLPDEKKRKRLKSRITHRKPVLSGYCVSFAQNERDLFEIINANELLQPFYKKKELVVVGLASDYDDAVSLVENMVMDVYNRTGGFDVRRFYGEEVT